ncbi:transglycosylase SLT domain-containing protein [Streptosporangium sp. NPDC051023]|uniref:transglycosylase SLT domain-containing protein n=1 Tax=Streptosporangium sp. NPDC051023 TaxID=3155410 RepID=UPI0034503362
MTVGTLEQVSTLPGGGALLDLANKVNADANAVGAIATRWRGTAGKLVEHAGTLGAAVNAVDEAWKGESADAFGVYMRKYGKAADALHDALANCANSLDTAAGVLRNSESKVGTVCSTLLDDVATYRSGNPDAKEKDLQPHIASLVNTAVADARPHVEAAEKAVTQALADVRKYMGERQLSFSGIPAPGDQTFVPGVGRTVVWERTVGYRPHLGPGGSADGGASGSGFGGYGASGPPPPGGGPAPTGQLKEWIDQALEILKARGYPVEKMNPSDIAMIIQHESGGNPHAINLWDSNAAAGHPSKGLMQTIDPTFNSYKLAGHDDIYNPVDNIIAGVRYAISRYGSVSNVPGVVGSKTGTGYVGY